MYRYFFLLCGITTPVWGQVVDSIPSRTIPPISHYRSSFMLDGGFAFAATFLPTIRQFFNENQVQRDKQLDRFVAAGLSYRRQRVKVMAQSFLGVSPTVFPSEQTNGTNLVARRQAMSGVTLLFGYDMANTRNKRIYLNAGVGGIRYEYNLYRPTNQIVSFGQILRPISQVSVPSLYLTSGFWEVNLEFTNREKRQSSFQGISRLGFRRRFHTIPWQSDAYQLADAPLEGISQLYLQIGFCVSRNYGGRSNQ